MHPATEDETNWYNNLQKWQRKLNPSRHVLLPHQTEDPRLRRDLIPLHAQRNNKDANKRPLVKDTLIIPLYRKNKTTQRTIDPVGSATAPTPTPNPMRQTRKAQLVTRQEMGTFPTHEKAPDVEVLHLSLIHI